MISDILNNAGSLEDEDDDEFTYPGTGDYSTQMEEFDGEEDSEVEQKSDDSDEDFLYDGVDANTSVSYKDQLREVLGQENENDEEEDEEEEECTEESLIHENGVTTEDDELQHSNAVFIHELSPDSRVSSPDSTSFPYKFSNPFLHPTVSRLRSFTPQYTKVDSNEASQSHLFVGGSPPTSGFSSSRRSSTSNRPSKRNGTTSPDKQTDQEVFKWTELNGITQTIYSKASQKASALLGRPLLGSPTVLAANGLICIGTTEGQIVAYDFKQTLLCICESTMPGSSVGAVTALALSHDHTFVAAGHATGYIQLYDLKHPQSPVRSVPPTTLAVVATGKKEGHLKGSRIVSIGFVAGRHTGLVSADDHGLAFFHSLGKVLFVDASDVLRILGRYPEPGPKELRASAIKQNENHHKHYTILCMVPLPLGAVAYSTDSYHIVALLTPTKLVVVGLRPTPRTWFKIPRDMQEGGSSKSRSKSIGCLAWFPTMSASSPDRDGAGADAPTMPTLAFSWGNRLHIVKVFESRIKQHVKSKSGKPSEVEIGTIAFEKFGKFTVKNDIQALQWLNQHQIVLISRGELAVYDLMLSRLVERIEFDGLSSTIPLNEQGSQLELDQFNHCFRVYKGKLFLLKKDKFVVGTLLTWADRILSLVKEGDFLQAIDLTRSYYTDEAPGNRNNLPTDPQRRKRVIGLRLKDLMDASAQYAFSEERLTDGTHVTPDGRGVDRTSVFEGMVEVCAKASIVLDDFEFLFEDLFQKYDDCGISSIYLRQLEPFVLDNQIRYVPPRITQRLIALHEEDGRPGLIERIIWHIDPSCLDLNQTIQLCQRYHLLDALIYINTRALRDYVAPIVELLGLIRTVQRFRRSQYQISPRTDTVDSSMESTIMNAYKIFPYMANVLSGLSYPSEEPLDAEEAFQAKKDIYLFLFFGRSSVWPPGEAGKLILTADEEGGIEPTYPYVRLLLVFDAESFLHSLDIALEDSYFNEESRRNDRLIIVKIVLEIMSSSVLPQDDITMVNIFVARNVAKFFQFLQLSPSTLHNILIGLAEDPNPTTREDRQLAAEYLLSVYNPHDSEGILLLFERARFYRILRTWYHHEQRWAKLLLAYVDDPYVHPSDLLKKVEDVISWSIKSRKGTIPDDLIPVISKSLPRLLRANSTATAYFLDHRLPHLHATALEAFGEGIEADNDRYKYLQTLLGLGPSDDDNDLVKPSTLSIQTSPDLQHRFFTLQCRFHSKDVISTLLHLPKESLDLGHVMRTCESLRVYDAAVWITNWQGQPGIALSKADTFQKEIVRRVVDAFAEGSKQLNVSDARSSLESLARVSCNICIDYSRKQITNEELAEDMWFKLLNSQIQNVQLMASSLPIDAEAVVEEVEELREMRGLLSTLRSLVQSSFSTLVSITSASAVSFPRLFKRLVDSTPSATGSHYTEFRIILTGMLESYQSDEDILIILKHLLERDVFETVAQVTKESACGWTISHGTCEYCRTALLVPPSSRVADVNEGIIVSRTGFASHSRCRPPSS